jgi:hypothetical protein
MIVKFEVGNFLSFRNDQSIHFRPSADHAHEDTHCIKSVSEHGARLHRAALLFGPNGAGKTNYLRALEVMKTLVLRSDELPDNEYARLYMPFGATGSASRPTTFSLELILEGRRFRYRMAYDDRRIRSECLHVYDSKKASRWYSRDYKASAGADKWSAFSSKYNGPRVTCRKRLGEKILFLTAATRSGATQLAPLVDWFANQLNIVAAPDLKTCFSAACMRNVAYKRSVLEILQSLDPRVLDIRVCAADPLTPGVQGMQQTLQLKLRRGPDEAWVNQAHESAGLQQALKLLSLLVSTSGTSQFHALDEFDAHLHPLVSRFLVRLLNDRNFFWHQSQMLLVSHDATLLDLDLLRRDQIWLMEMSAAGESGISLLQDKSPRRQEAICKAYLRGKYGAVPQTNFASLPLKVLRSAVSLGRSQLGKLVSLAMPLLSMLDVDVPALMLGGC